MDPLIFEPPAVLTLFPLPVLCMNVCWHRFLGAAEDRYQKFVVGLMQLPGGILPLNT